MKFQLHKNGGSTIHPGNEHCLKADPWPTTPDGWDEYLTMASIAVPHRLEFYRRTLNKWGTLKDMAGDNLTGESELDRKLVRGLIAALERRFHGSRT